MGIYVVAIPFNYEGIVLVSEVDGFVKFSAFLRCSPLSPCTSRVELFGQLRDHVFELQNPMVGLVHFILILEQYVFCLVLDFESKISLAGRNTAEPIIQCLLCFVREVAPRAHRHCEIFGKSKIGLAHLL